MHIIRRRRSLVVTLSLVFVLISAISLSSCAPSVQTPPTQSETQPPAQSENQVVTTAPQQTIDEPGSSIPARCESEWVIRIANTEGEELFSFTESELSHILPDGRFAQRYSTINRWPTPRIHVAEGYLLTDILQAAGLLDTTQRITLRATDGYEMSLTREQLLSPQYFFPFVGENDTGAEPVGPIIAYRWRDGTDDFDDLMDHNPTLLIGQRNPFEHTNHIFVTDLDIITVDDSPSETWPKPTTFPLPGYIPIGETVRLQHSNLGLVHVFFTVDGSDPTPLSTLFNPSIFRPELNVSVEITEPTVIRAFARGFGRNDSEIAVFEFTPVP